MSQNVNIYFQMGCLHLKVKSTLASMVTLILPDLVLITQTGESLLWFTHCLILPLSRKYVFGLCICYWDYTESYEWILKHLFYQKWAECVRILGEIWIWFLTFFICQVKRWNVLALSINHQSLFREMHSCDGGLRSLNAFICFILSHSSKEEWLKYTI